MNRLQRSGKLPDNEENKYNLPTSSIEDTKVLKLPYNASTFTLSYVALSYTSPDAIRYAYKLEGVDKDWNYMDQNKNPGRRIAVFRFDDFFQRSLDKGKRGTYLMGDKGEELYFCII